MAPDPVRVGPVRVGPVRVGIAGATVTTGGSGWAAEAHIPALRALPGVELVAVCTSREETARVSADAFGAALAFHDVTEMAAHPDVDLVVVAVRAPRHRECVMAALAAGTPVLCEWPLGISLAEAEDMAAVARARSVPTMIGLQARADPHVRYARDLLRDGYVGEILLANLSVSSPAILRRGAGRLWQADRANGANPLTVQGGHALDALCYLLGEFVEVSARAATRTRQWRHRDTDEPVTVTAPDTIGVLGHLAGGIEVAAQIATVPSHPGGARLDVYGREGSLHLSGPSIQIGPNRLTAGRGPAPVAELVPPDRYLLVPAAAPAGRPRNIAQGYARIAEALRRRRPYDPDFDQAVVRHRLLDAIERSADEARAVTV
jgi:predicted dehydrogenase